MTIDELIEQAQDRTHEAITERDTEGALRFAATAQAAALTAIAMLLREVTDPGVRSNGDEFRTLMVDLGQ